MTATPPPGLGDNPPSGSVPDFEAASYGQYSASSGASANVPPAATDPTTYGQQAPAYGPPQPTPAYGPPQPTPVYGATQATPTSLGTPAQGPFTSAPAYGDTYPQQVPLNPYPTNQVYAGPTTVGQGYPDQYGAGKGYPDQYGGSQGYPQPGIAASYGPQDYGTPGYPPNQTYAQGYVPQGEYPAYGMAPVMMAAPLPTGMAVAAMVCGIVGLVTSLCGGWTIALSIVGIVLGAIGVRKAGRGEVGGRSMAIAGIITGGIGGAIAVIVMIFYLMVMMSGN
jgi:hypothetical protein